MKSAHAMGILTPNCMMTKIPPYLVTYASWMEISRNLYLLNQHWTHLPLVMELMKKLNLF